MLKLQKSKVIFLILLIVLSGLSLSGCSVYKGSFDCKPRRGVGCEPVSKVNELINDERLDEFADNLEAKQEKKCDCDKSKNIVVKNDIVDKDQNLDSEKMTIHFNEYRDKGVIYKESEVEVGIK